MYGRNISATLVENITKQDIQQSKLIARAQSNNTLCFTYRQHSLTASKAYDVMTRYVTIRGSDNNLDGFRAIFTKISGTVRGNPEP